MELLAGQWRWTLPSQESLRTMISRWEGGHRVPDAYNGKLLCAALGLEGSLSPLGYEPAGDLGVVLREARRRRQWTQLRLAFEMELVAGRWRWRLPSRQSLTVMICWWERGHQVPDDYYGKVLYAALGLQPRQPGQCEDPDI
jgi:hypothetical protein